MQVIDQVERHYCSTPDGSLVSKPAHDLQLCVLLIADEIRISMALSREIDARLKTKCDKVADAFVMDDIVLEQILGVLIKLVKDLKLQHQHKYYY
ncbi:AUGMIN subunit 4, partial [Cucurbita argyrosperma subsp. argyrosperma]